MGIIPGQYLHEGRFPGSIGPHQCMDLTAFGTEIHPLQGFDTWKLNGYILHFQFYLIHAASPSLHV